MTLYANSKISLDRLPPLSVIRAEIARREASREDRETLLKGEDVRSSLTSWAIEVLSEYDQVPSRHHRFIMRELEALSRGENDRLLLLCPPGSAKSRYASQIFPPWFFAHYPRAAVIAASHTSDLADHFGRIVRNIVARHQRFLGYTLSADSKAAGRWETSQGGEYLAAGIGGAISGRRADLAIIDDPVKSREDADSETSRNKVWNWYRGDLYPRLKPGARICLIMTHWHEDDLAGRLLAEQSRGGDQWKVVKLPAFAEAGDPLGRELGEALWPEWENVAAIQRKREVMGEREFSALFQQNPIPDSGSYFKREWLIIVDKMPPKDSMRIYGGSDYAVTSDGGDFTVHAVIGIDPEGDPWLLDIWRKQAASDEWVDAFCDLVIKWNPMTWAEESGQIKSGVGPFLEKQMRERKAYTAREQFATRGDKSVRAQSFRGLVATRGLRIPASASWRGLFESEMLRFPAGVHDDQVDACGLIGQLLDTMVDGPRPKEPDKSTSDGYSSGHSDNYRDLDALTV
jgi:predicted phage terminase large subunit-like protein